jgi:hypothetical protein
MIKLTSVPPVAIQHWMIIEWYKNAPTAAQNVPHASDKNIKRPGVPTSNISKQSPTISHT